MNQPSFQLSDRHHRFVLKQTDADAITSCTVLQTLWSGYGRILRIALAGGACQSVIVKWVSFERVKDHPRGWQSSVSHERKLRSYGIEAQWYQGWASECDATCRLPQCFGIDESSGERMMVLEDLDAQGYPLRVRTPTLAQIQSCLRWLAHFHAKFLNRAPKGLWPIGTYWHLATRPDEWAAMPEGRLKRDADKLDALLAQCPWQTLVHGDAKLENFCFSSSGFLSTDKGVAAVDFQYVGGGCGIKDVAYLISSCFSEEGCEAHASQLVTYYFDVLTQVLQQQKTSIDIEALVAAWRALYPVAWADFYRFLQGWSPGHWKMHAYSERMTQEALSCLD